VISLRDVTDAPPDADAEADRAPSAMELDWFAAEPPLARLVIEDLRRLMYRARARLIPILVISVAITGALVWKLAHKPARHIAKIVLALQEGEVSQRNAPMPMRDLRTYVTTVLMPAAELTKMIEKRDLFPLRKKQGPEFALNELWDTIEVDVFRNYFLFEQDEMGEERSARIAVTVQFSDPDLAYEIARDLGNIIIASAGVERDRAARVMADDAARATEAARARAAELEAGLSALTSQRDEAVRAGQKGKVAALRVEIAAAENSVKRARDGLSALTKESSTDQLIAAVYAAGLGFDVSMVEERKPEPAVPTGYRNAVLAVLTFLTVLVIVATFLGAFDTRIHDLDDVTRLGIPVVGQVPGFPGDGVGSLRERGITRRGVPWSWR